LKITAESEAQSLDVEFRLMHPHLSEMKKEAKIYIRRL
jgi:hypothetical protein